MQNVAAYLEARAKAKAEIERRARALFDAAFLRKVEAEFLAKHANKD